MSAAYTPRHYVLADTDRMSEEKICTFESLKQQSDSQVRMMELLVLTQCGDAQRELTELCGLHGPAAAPQHSAEVQIQQSVPPLDSAEDLLLPQDCIIIGRRVLTQQAHTLEELLISCPSGKYHTVTVLHCQAKSTSAKQKVKFGLLATSISEVILLLCGLSCLPKRTI